MAKQQPLADAPIKKPRANLGDLIHLGNVELRRTKPTLTEKRTKTGMEKVIQYALWERGLDTKGKKRAAGKKSRDVPVGTPLSERAASFLGRETRREVV